MIIALTFLIGVFSSFTQTEAFSVGSCARTPIIANFDATKYTGRWFEIERSNVAFEKNLACVTATYSLLNASTVDVLNQGFNTVTNKPDTANGYATIPNLGEPNRLKVKFPGSPFPGNYDVWKTDYQTYTLIYSCTQIIPAVLKYELIWILARDRTLSQTVVSELKGFLTQNGVSVSDFEQTPQSNCN